MPIYDYTCSACGKTTEVVHGINEPAPKFCPVCGTEGAMKKAFSPPSILFKGSGWAKVDRRSSSGGSSVKSASEAKPKDTASADGSRSSSSSSESSDAKAGEAKAGDAHKPSSSSESTAKGKATSGGSD